MIDDHSMYHSPNAFCGNAGPEEMEHLKDLLNELSDQALKRLVKGCGINFAVDEDKLEREDYEGVIDEVDREDFYRVYKSIIEARENLLL